MFKKIILFVFACFIFAQGADAQNKNEKQWVRKQYNALSFNEKIAQLMIIRAHSNWDAKKVDSLASLIKKYNVGGLCFFQGGPVREATQTNLYQSIAKTPLLITMDAEWGVGMRLDSVEMFPRQLSLGAMSSSNLIYEMGAAVAAQCKRLGIQVNYAPVADINNNPANPVINDRSFGQNKQTVSEYSIAYMKGMQDNGIMATAKHFPGHGDVTVDSHLDIPLITKTREQLDAMEMVPFKALIDAGIESVMVAHLSVPSIDNTPNLAMSLSAKAVNGILKNELGFKGLSITDALDMKAISNYFPQGEANVQAIIAGNDMLCLPGDIEQTIQKIRTAIKEKRISRDDIKKRVLKVLTAKYKHGLYNKQFIDTTNITADLNKSVAAIKEKMASQSLTFINDNTPQPTLNKNKKIVYVALNQSQENNLTKQLSELFQVKIIYVGAGEVSQLQNLKTSLTEYDQVIIGLHNYNKRPAKHFEIPSPILTFLQEEHPASWLHLIFGNPYAVADFNKIKNILFAYEDNVFTQNAVLQWLQGKIQAAGKLPVTVSDNLPLGASYKNEAIPIATIVQAQETSLGIDINKLSIIDSLVEDAIFKKAIPGCQVLVAKNNKIVFNKAYGKIAGEQSAPVTLETSYDLASVTKVSATTVSIMKLVEEGKVDINKTIGDYLPWVVGNEKAKITLKDLLLHQAGLFPFIKFYESLMKPDGSFIDNLVVSVSDKDHHKMITPTKYLLDSWMDTIQYKILKSPITTAGKYVYSDNDFIFLGQIVEQVSGMNLNEYTTQNFYSPLGMTSTGFLPLQKTSLDKIAATEVDDYYRHELLQGAVHDEGASVMGGIAGHAGLFSNATDLAKLYEMLLNKGEWEGKKYFEPATVARFTAYNTENSRRGLGFDKPEKNNASLKDPYPSLSVSPSTFGHTGFTGTCVWADPEHDLLFIFLANRVYPTRNNKAYSELNLRPKIQEAIYRALK
ncbi:MAG: glycoside hydrolase family 3 N-terminal domain-containing protein [Chitinophagia bacterium]